MEQLQNTNFRPNFFLVWLRALRWHQWSKNFLVVVPLIVGHRFDWPVLWRAGLAVVTFCFCASSVYVVNDLRDLESDRAHPTKTKRPFAANHLSLRQGLAAILILAAVSVGCGIFLPAKFLMCLGIYYFISVLYSWVIKQMLLLDVFALAGLYTIRIFAGGAATQIELSGWLLGFSMFLFLSLALLKRYVELHRMNLAGRKFAAGRNYVTSDLPILLSFGPLSGWLAVLILSLYLNSEDARLLYQHPLRLLLICPLLIYWISRLWLLATRDAVHDDPVVFALKDFTSYIVGLLMALIIWFASV